MQWLTWMFPGALGPPPESDNDTLNASRDAVRRANSVADRVETMLHNDLQLERARRHGHGHGHGRSHDA